MQLAELLQWLSQGQKTGTLVFDNGQIEKRVFFRDGHPLRCEIEGAKPRPSSHDAVMRVLDWKMGHFEFTEEEVTASDEIGADVSSMITGYPDECSRPPPRRASRTASSSASTSARGRGVSFGITSSKAASNSSRSAALSMPDRSEYSRIASRTTSLFGFRVNTAVRSSRAAVSSSRLKVIFTTIQPYYQKPAAGPHPLEPRPRAATPPTNTLPTARSRPPCADPGAARGAAGRRRPSVCRSAGTCRGRDRRSRRPRRSGCPR